MNISELIDKTKNFEELSQTEQVKLMSYFFTIVNKKPLFNAIEIKSCFDKENLTIPANVSREFSTLCKKPFVLVPKSKGIYSFHRTSKNELDKIYLVTDLVKKTNSELRDLMKKVNSQEQRQFLNEVINCFEIDSRRASIVMMWLLTIDTLFEFIIKKKLNEFNAAIQTHGKYKKISISKKDDFNEIKENDFIEIMKVGSIITKDERKILDQKLGLRNTCAHPNSIKVSKSSVMACIEDLIENIIIKYS